MTDGKNYLKKPQHWSREWFELFSIPQLQSMKTEAEQAYQNAFRSHQLTSRLMWETRIEKIRSELERRLTG